KTALKFIRHILLIVLLSGQWLYAGVYNGYIIGYLNSVFYAGDNLFDVPFQIGSSNNLLSGIFSLENHRPPQRDLRRVISEGNERRNFNCD
ncbi:MAG: hypothetical protein WCS94_22575, partial [Verrucomicrobiota bacterium]